MFIKSHELNSTWNDPKNNLRYHNNIKTMINLLLWIQDKYLIQTFSTSKMAAAIIQRIYSIVKIPILRA